MYAVNTFGKDKVLPRAHGSIVSGGTVAQLVEHCTNIAEVRVWIPIQDCLAENGIFTQAFFFSFLDNEWI